MAAAVVVMGVIVAKLSWRGSGDEAHSVRHYQSALEAIEQMSNRNARLLREPSEQAPGDPSGPPPPGRGGRLMFDDTHAGERRSPDRGDVAPAFRSDRARRHAIESMDHRPRRWGFSFAVLVLLAVIGGLVYLGSRHHNNQPTASNSTSTTKATSGTTHPAGAASTGHHGTGSTTTRPRTTTTTAPRQLVAVSTSSSGSSAVYSAPTGSYQLTLAATTGTCWVDAADAATGNTLYVGTLQPGASQTVQVSGQATVEIGSTTVAMSVNGVPVVFPTPFRTPFNAALTPGATGSGSSSTTTSTSASTGTTATTSPASSGSGSSLSGSGSTTSST